MARQQAKQVAALQDTLRAEFKLLGPSAQAQGHLLDYTELAKKVKETMGPELAAEIRKQGGRVVASVQGTALVPGSEVSQHSDPPDLPNGGFDTTVVQGRPSGLPPLTEARLRYVPNLGLTTNWINYSEQYKLNFATWRTDKDGMRAGASLSREVFDPEGKSLGTEQIPLTGAEAFFPGSEVRRVESFPKYGIGLGIGRDELGRTRPNLIFEKHLTRNWSIMTGYVNGSSLILGKYTWGRN
jgi:hypothetical protein